MEEKYSKYYNQKQKQNHWEKLALRTFIVIFLYYYGACPVARWSIVIILLGRERAMVGRVASLDK